MFTAPTLPAERFEVIDADKAYAWELALEIVYAIRARVVRHDDLQWWGGKLPG
jgi:hypothetical protein